MSVQFQKVGNRQTFHSKPSDGSATTVYTASNVRATLSSVNISCHTAGNATVIINDGSTDFTVLDGYVMSVNTSELFTFGSLVLEDGHSVKVQSNTGDYFTYTVTIEEETRSQQ